MKLPNADRVVVDLAKLRDYCLSATHPRGRHKARVFQSALGFTASDAELLRSALLDAARTEDANPSRRDAYGQRYVIDCNVTGQKGIATIRSFWIVRHGEDFPRFNTCYVRSS